MVNGSDGQLAVVDLNGCVEDQIANVGNFTDIASHPDGNIYAVNSDGELYKIDLENTLVSLVTTFPGAFYYALTANSNGTLYAATAGGTLVSYNTNDQNIIEYPNIGVGAGGDLTFYKGQLYIASNDNSIVSVHPTNPSLNEVVIDFTDSNTEIFGVVSTLVDCEIKSYAISGDNLARIFEIRWEEKTFLEVCTANIRIFGGSSEFEFKSSENAFKISDFEKSNTSCEVADVTVSLNASGVGEDLQFSLDGVDFQTSNTFEDLDFGKHIFFMKDELGCTGFDSIDILPGDLDVELVDILPSTCGLANGAIEFNASSNANKVNYILNGREVNANTKISGIHEGDFLLEILDSDGCEDEISFLIEGIDAAYLSSVITDPAKCGSYDGKILAESSDESAIFYLDGIPNESGKFESLPPKKHLLRMEDSNGCVIDSTIVIKAVKECNVFIPNVFSPNNDGVNDKLVIYSDVTREISDFYIFDRWGSMVFQLDNYLTNDGQSWWDGTINGSNALEGIYILSFSLKGEVTNVPFSAEFNLTR